MNTFDFNPNIPPYHVQVGLQYALSSIMEDATHGREIIPVLQDVCINRGIRVVFIEDENIYRIQCGNVKANSLGGSDPLKEDYKPTFSTALTRLLEMIFDELTENAIPD